jgi:phosphoenolpyruvate synthase/pyruvate phosphate dikinase
MCALQVATTTGVVVPYKLGTMIEVPRGALMAGELAKTATFFSFGTNDLTQMTFGISRDDAQARFLTHYIKDGLLPSDPFETIDEVRRGACVTCRVALCVTALGAGWGDLWRVYTHPPQSRSAGLVRVFCCLGGWPALNFSCVICLHSPVIDLRAQAGVGELVRIAAERGRATRPDLSLGICGEHGGDPASIDFFARVGLDYVSCSPLRVPIARLAAAQVGHVLRVVHRLSSKIQALGRGTCIGEQGGRSMVCAKPLIHFCGGPTV